MGGNISLIEGRVPSMEVPIALIAEYANADMSGKLNIIGAFNRIGLGEFPGIFHSMYMVIRLTAGLGEFDQERIMKVILYDEDGNQTWETPDLTVKIGPPKAGRTAEYNAIMGIRDLAFEKPGRYEFRIFLDKDLKGDIPIDVVQYDELFEE